MATTQLPPRRRRCGPKVKSGCQTCKIRRVKCDEAKPYCKRCTSTGRKCDGYVKSTLVIKPGDGLDMALAKRISTCIPGTAEERRGFSYFLNNTAAELSGYFDTSFWQELLLQASAVEPALRHAVIGIGTLHESFANRKLDYSPDNIERGFAINQYTKAIGHLRRSLATGKQEPLTALMSCILFVCFDSLRGHFESAMVHLQSGLRILRDLRTNSAADEHIIAKSLAPAFKRLSIQSILYIDTTDVAIRASFAAELMDLDMREVEAPEMFETLEQARNILNQAASGLFRTFYMYDPDLPYCCQPEITVPLHQKYSNQLAEWNKIFEKFMAAKSASLTSREIRGAAMLKIQHTAASIMVNSSPPDQEDLRTLGEVVSLPDKLEPYLPDFQTIVNLSRSLIMASEADAKSGKPPLTFSTDLGMVGPLYYCCVKCPSHSVRQAALELITRCPRREGMWDSETIARLVKGYWALEAQHNAQQERIECDFGSKLPLQDMVDLVFKDGMKWEWRFRDPTWISGDTAGFGRGHLATHEKTFNYFGNL